MRGKRSALHQLIRVQTGISKLQLQTSKQQQQNSISGNAIIKTVKSYSYTEKAQVANIFFLDKREMITLIIKLLKVIFHHQKL